MKGSKEYFLKLQEENYNILSNDEKMYLNNLGMEIRQIPTNEDIEDEKIKYLKKEIAKNYEKINNYLFEKRNK
jgi:HD superfamily phosphodiesterase